MKKIKRHINNLIKSITLKDIIIVTVYILFTGFKGIKATIIITIMATLLMVLLNIKKYENMEE